MDIGVADVEKRHFTSPDQDSSWLVAEPVAAMIPQ
jgi:hypothetical protein